MPVFEGLFGSWDDLVQDLLYDLAVWHALAKLRLHRESTLELLTQATRHLGFSLRRWVARMCRHVETFENERERRARVDRAQKHGKPPANATRKRRNFNLATYKLHALGDYVPAIRLFGTTDGWSTQPVSVDAYHGITH
jgi:hypothetical protein